jgi:NAD(P)-dependent dehydrogenase (short-subunit alcohol dehydrogenase family)
MLSKPGDGAMIRLDGRRVLVTGGGSGIGRAIALGACAAGARVVIADVRAEGMDEVAASADGECKIVSILADITDPKSVRDLVDGCVAKLGGLDGLVNSAGVISLAHSEDVTDEEFERILAVNLVGAFRVTREVGRVMLAAGSGAIVEIASLSSFGAFPGRLAYSVSKAGVAEMTRTLAAEWARRGVRVNALVPGFVHTPANDALIARGEFDVTAIVARTPMGRRAEPEDMVGPALFLLSDASGFITSHSLVVDGGWLPFVGPVDKYVGVGA